MIQAANLGFPRIGAFRELKKAVESFWKGASSEAELMNTAVDLRAKHWKMQADAGIEVIPSNDFSFYDQVLDMTCTLGLVPPRYKWKGGAVDLDLYFAMARDRLKPTSDSRENGSLAPATAIRSCPRCSACRAAPSA